MDPFVFSYFYSIVERANRFARELGASAKRATLNLVPRVFSLAWGWGKDPGNEVGRRSQTPPPNPACLALTFSFAFIRTRSVTYNTDREDGDNERYVIDHRFLTSCFTVVPGDSARCGFCDVPEFLAACWRGCSGC